MTNELTADEIIDALGGTSETARICQVKDPSVSEWRRNGIPRARLMFLKLARPEVFSSEGRLAPGAGRAGRQLPSSTNNLDTVPEHSVVGVDPRSRA